MEFAGRWTGAERSELLPNINKQKFAGARRGEVESSQGPGIPSIRATYGPPTSVARISKRDGGGDSVVRVDGGAGVLHEGGGGGEEGGGGGAGRKGGGGIARAAEVSVRGEGSVAECGVRIGGGAGGGCERRRAGLARDLGRLRGGNRR